MAAACHSASTARTIVHGYDLDEASVELARSNVRDAGLEERVKMFHSCFNEKGGLRGYLARPYDMVHEKVVGG